MKWFSFLRLSPLVHQRNKKIKLWEICISKENLSHLSGSKYMMRGLFLGFSNRNQGKILKQTEIKLNIFLYTAAT